MEEILHSLPLPLFILVRAGFDASHAKHRIAGHLIAFIANDVVFLDGHTHVTSVPALAPVAFILTDATLNANASVFTPLAGSLAIAALFTLPTALAARLSRQVFLVSAKLMLKIDR